MDHGGEPAQKRKYTKKAKLGVSDDTSSNDGGGGISAADLKLIGSMFTSQGNPMEVSTTDSAPKRKLDELKSTGSGGTASASAASVSKKKLVPATPTNPAPSLVPPAAPAAATPGGSAAPGDLPRLDLATVTLQQIETECEVRGIKFDKSRIWQSIVDFGGPNAILVSETPQYHFVQRVLKRVPQPAMSASKAKEAATALARLEKEHPLPANIPRVTAGLSRQQLMDECKARKIKSLSIATKPTMVYSLGGEGTVMVTPTPEFQVMKQVLVRAAVEANQYRSKLVADRASRKATLCKHTCLLHECPVAEVKNLGNRVLRYHVLSKDSTDTEFPVLDDVLPAFLCPTEASRDEIYANAARRHCVYCAKAGCCYACEECSWFVCSQCYNAKESKLKTEHYAKMATESVRETEIDSQKALHVRLSLWHAMTCDCTSPLADTAALKFRGASRSSLSRIKCSSCSSPSCAYSCDKCDWDICSRCNCDVEKACQIAGDVFMAHYLQLYKTSNRKAPYCLAQFCRLVDEASRSADGGVALPPPPPSEATQHPLVTDPPAGHTDPRLLQSYVVYHYDPDEESAVNGCPAVQFDSTYDHLYLANARARFIFSSDLVPDEVKTNSAKVTERTNRHTGCVDLKHLGAEDAVLGSREDLFCVGAVPREGFRAICYINGQDEEVA